MTDTKDYWPCACCKHKRDKSSPTGKTLTHIKLHPPTATKCRVCGVTKADHDKIEAEIAARKAKTL